MSQLHRLHPLVVLPSLLLATWACEIGGEEQEQQQGGLVAQVSNDECASGLRWAGGDEESPRMYPGRECVGCHQQRGEGPSYLIAGTVYEMVHEADDCFGLDGVTVEITDANGSQWSLPTNDAGNFFLSESQGPVAFPYRAAVVMGGNRVEMVTPQSDGRCLTCHTSTGAMGAAGRIMAP